MVSIRGVRQALARSGEWFQSKLPKPSFRALSTKGEGTQRVRRNTIALHLSFFGNYSLVPKCVGLYVVFCWIYRSRGSNHCALFALQNEEKRAIIFAWTLAPSAFCSVKAGATSPACSVILRSRSSALNSSSICVFLCISCPFFEIFGLVAQIAAKF